LRGREANLWRLLGRDLSTAQRARLESLLSIPEGSCNSFLDQLRSVQDERTSAVVGDWALEVNPGFRHCGTGGSAGSSLKDCPFPTTAKVAAIGRLPSARRIAVLVAFVVHFAAVLIIMARFETMSHSPANSSFRNLVAATYRIPNSVDLLHPSHDRGKFFTAISHGQTAIVGLWDGCVGKSLAHFRA
jgi:hypothetical protein